MALSQEDKIRLIQAYAPTLIFHPEEKFLPMRPEVYLQASALWSEQPVEEDSKKGSWGNPNGRPDVFPRKPIIPRFGISVRPAEDVEGASDPDGDGVGEWYLGHLNQLGVTPYLKSDGERALWLDFGDWEDAADVTDASQNAHANLAEVERRVREEPTLSAARDWYYADVDDLDSLQNLLLSLDVAGGNLPTLLQQLYGDVWVIWYYFFFPAHDSLLKDCEQRIDGGRDGSYEGDWAAVGVLVRKPNLLPWQHGTPFPTAERVFFSVNLQGAARVLAPDLFTHGMLAHAWNDVQKMDTHVRAYIAHGTHNGYRVSGEQALIEPKLLGIPVEKYLCNAVNAVGGVVDDVNNFVNDAGETAKDMGVMLAKALAGAAAGNALPGIGAGLGALGGALAGLAEALASSSDDPSPPPTTGKDQGPPPAPQQYGVVLTPPEVVQPLIINDPDPDKNEAAIQVRTWAGEPAEHLVDRHSQVWWDYQGAWGVRSTADKYGLRSGVPLPDFKKLLFRSLVVSLSK
jgi:hypothetical protein